MQSTFYFKIQIYAFKNPFWGLSDGVMSFTVDYVFGKRRTQLIYK